MIYSFHLEEPNARGLFEAAMYLAFQCPGNGMEAYLLLAPASECVCPAKMYFVFHLVLLFW